MRLARHLLVVALLCALIAAPHAAAGAPPVTLVLATERGFPITGSQEWYQLLTRLGVAGLQIRSATGRDKPAVEKIGTKDAPHYAVTGILGADGTLHVPGGRFTLRDDARIKRWLENLSDQGVEGVTERRIAFGLLPKQLEAVNEDLKRPVGFTTRGVALRSAVERAGAGLEAPLVIDPASSGAMENVLVADELQELSRGTALAIMLRPAGLVLQPERPAGGRLQYRVAASRPGQEAWPTGWVAQQDKRRVLPALYELIDVEINGVPVAETLDALQQRLKVPFLFDHNALAMHNIDPRKVEAKLPAKRLTHSLILQRVLFQARLKWELRVDEAGKPLVWITTLKPA